MCGMQIKWYFGEIYRLKCLHGKEKKLIINETENKWEFTISYYHKQTKTKATGDKVEKVECGK